MFRRILVPVDGTGQDQHSLLLAGRLAKRFDASVFLVRVRSPKTDSHVALDDVTDLKALASNLQQQGIACHFTLDLDQTVEGIVATARHQENDLIVLAPHHRSWLEAIRHPSVTDDMLSQTPAPLLIWPEHMSPEAAMNFLAAPTAQVMVPLDGGEMAEQALPFATALARQYERPLMLVRVVSPIAIPFGVYPGDASVAEQVQDAARAYLQRVRERIASQVTFPVQSMLLSGLPWAELLRVSEAHPDSIIVMTTHGRGHVGRALFGGVTTELAHRGSCPIFALRRGATVHTNEPDPWLLFHDEKSEPGERSPVYQTEHALGG